MTTKQIQSLKQFPRLKRHLQRGTIWIELGDYVGMAHDRVEVFLGNVGRESNVESYLTSCPTSKDW